MGNEQVLYRGNESKKRPDLNYCLFSVKSYDRKNLEVFCKRADKKLKRLIDPGICSLHFKETDIAITFLSVKIFLQAVIRLSLTPKLIDRGYPETLIMSTRSVIKFEDKKLALQQRCKEDKRIFSFVTQYHSTVPDLKRILMQKWHLIQQQPLLSEIFIKDPPIVS